MAAMNSPPSLPCSTTLVQNPKKPTTSNTKSQAPPDPNLPNPRLLVNGACIYERRLPGDAYITAHVQRLQHGFYASTAVSDSAYNHVDFLGINFVFHSPNTLTHRFKAATIRASVQGTPPVNSSGSTHHPNGHARFLKHAPHLILGTVSPETRQWNYSLSGTLGVGESPRMASLGAINGRYRRYEMMRIQGSVRTLKSKSKSSDTDIDAGEIVWSLEENSLQRSGLPREFAFAMLIQKPRSDAPILFALDIQPTLQLCCGSYPAWWLSLPKYRPQRRRAVDFRSEVGQRFEPVTSPRGFNFATLESSFDDYVSMPGRRFVCRVSPDKNHLLLQEDDLQHSQRNYTLEPLQRIPDPIPPTLDVQVLMANNDNQLALSQGTMTSHGAGTSLHKTKSRESSLVYS